MAVNIFRMLALWALVVTGGVNCSAQTGDLPRTSPEAVGLRSAQVSAFFDSLLVFPGTEIHSVIVMRHGRVVGEMYPAPFRADYMHTLFSCSKTFVAAAVGIAVGEGLLRVDDRVVTFFPGQLPPTYGWRLASITVGDLLTMRSGFAVDTKMRTQSLHWVRDYLARPMTSEPGKRFQYDSIDTYLLSAIVQKVTGMTLLDYLKAKVFNRLNIRQVRWEQCPEGVCVGGWGLYLQAESLAKFGQLLLQRGRWHGDQLIPATWVDDMMREHVKRKEGDGYGYQMWVGVRNEERLRVGERSSGMRGAVRADGAYGQYIVIVPEKDVVVVITQCTSNSGERERSFIWQTLFDGMRDGPLPPSADYGQLQERTYTLPLLEGDETNKLIDGYIGRSLTLAPNPLGWSALKFEAQNAVEITDTAGRASVVGICWLSWQTSPIDFFPLNARYAVKNQFSTISPPFHVGACYAWQEDQLMVKMHYVDWMSSVLLKFRFDGDSVYVEGKENYQKAPVYMKGRLVDS